MSVISPVEVASESGEPIFRPRAAANAFVRMTLSGSFKKTSGSSMSSALPALYERTDCSRSMSIPRT